MTGSDKNIRKKNPEEAKNITNRNAI